MAKGMIPVDIPESCYKCNLTRVYQNDFYCKITGRFVEHCTNGREEKGPIQSINSEVAE